MKKAKLSDLIKDGKPIPGVKIAVKSVRNPDFPIEYYTLNKDTDPETLMAFIEAESIWIVIESKWQIEL